MFDRRLQTVIILLGLAACLPEPEYVAPHQPDDDSVRHTGGFGMLAEHPDDTIVGDVSVGFTKIAPPGGAPFYEVWAEYQGPNYLRLRHGKSLVFIVDSVELIVAGTKYEPSFEQRSFGRFAVSGRTRDVVIEGGVYGLSKAHLRSLSRAEVVDVWLIGATKRIRRRAEAEHMELLREFVNEHVPLHGGPHPRHP